MNLRPYLPSPHFSRLVGSIGLAALIIFAAKAYTSPHEDPTTPDIVPSSATTNNDLDWQVALAQVQAQSGISLPEGINQADVDALLSAAKTDNVTATVGRSLLVNLTNAKAQGLGDDLPTQDQLIAAAKAQLPGSSSKTYAQSDLVVVAQTPQSQKTYGNNLILTLEAHPAASAESTLEAMGYAVDYQDKARLSAFSSIAAEYRALARDMAKLSVPQTLAPLHLVVVNDFAAMADTFADMSAVISDPLRGVAGLRQYQSLVSEVSRVFINIGQQLNKNGILFNKDEPGAAWNVLLSP